MKSEKDELKKLNEQQLKEKVEFYKRELFSLRLKVFTSHVKDNSQFKKLRKKIAWALTYLRLKKETNH